jgi:hypothetical protein
MKYQALKQLKTKNKLLKMCDTLKEAHEIIKADGGNFHNFSYIGGFPIYKSNTHHYSIQGKHEAMGMVMSLSDSEKLAFNFNA